LNVTRFDPELESKYRRYYLPADAQRLNLGVILWTISFVGFVYSDYLLYGQQDAFFALLAVRVSYALFGLGMLVALRRVESNPAAFDGLVLAWSLGTVLFALLVGLLRPRGDISVLIDDLLAVFSFYVFISNRMALRVLPAAILSLANLGLTLFYKEGIPGQMILSLAFAFTVTNLVGIVYSRHYFGQRRAEFLARREETRVQSELHRLASTDSLTGVYNRRRLLELAGDAFYRFRRYDRPFSILVMDLDDFKLINDTYGHQQGDAVLVEFVRSVTEEKREGDALGRMGGDEFCLVLPESNKDAAMTLAERLIQRTNELVLDDGRGPMRVTVSIGISQAVDGDTSLDPLYARADAALYRAKNSGRNRYEVV
jgi:diguanylate cyclase (GGDEF)-like protein